MSRACPEQFARAIRYTIGPMLKEAPVELWESQVCYCCRRPLIFRQETKRWPTPGNPNGEAVVESWDCTNPDCYAAGKSLPKIPTPPLTK